MLSDPTSLTIAAFGLLFAGVIKGMTGLGYASCALPFVAAVVGLKEAMPLVLLPAMVSNIVVICTTPHRLETLFRFLPLYLATVPGMIAGIAFLVWFDQKIPTIVLGLLIVAYSSFSIARPTLRIPAGYERGMQMPVGLLNGFFTGLTGSQVLPLVPYILGLHLDNDRSVQAINLAIASASAFMLIALWQSGAMAPASFFTAVLALGPAMVGIYLGTRCRSFISAQHFRLIVQFVLGFLGLALIAKQLMV